MAFMQPVIEYGDWYVIYGDAGGTLLPTDVLNGELPMDPDNPEYVHGDSLWELNDYYEGKKVTEARVEKGWAYRLSAPGYMDATDWSGPFEDDNEARHDLRETYEVCPYTGDPLPIDDPEIDTDACTCGACEHDDKAIT